MQRREALIHRWRYIFALSVVLICMAGLIWRMVHLTIVDRQFLLEQGNARVVRVVETPAYRGMITDRNHEPLAVSTSVDSIWVDPKNFKPTTGQLQLLADHLHMTRYSLTRKLKQNRNREFLYLQRQVDPKVAGDVKRLNINGVFLQREFRRYYPEGEVTAHVLGLTNIDDHGLEGLELEYEKWLQGVPGRKKVLKDRLGRVIAEVSQLREAVPGHDLELSLDRRISYVAYQVLKQTIKDYHAKSGSVVVLDVKTGEILTMVNYPSYNPNIRHQSSGGRYRNRAITDIFEPGSTFKTFAVATALENGRYTPFSTIDTNPGWLPVGNNLVKDHHNNGKISLTDVLKRSSNVGVAKVILSMSPKEFSDELMKFGFGQRSRTGFPGESSGLVIDSKRWSPFEMATMAFGYGISVTPLQLAHAYSIIAAAGVKRSVTLAHLEKPNEGKQVISKDVAKELLLMLESVVKKGGTGYSAQIASYRVAGKTGTSRMAKEGGYYKNRHVASFVGIAPVSDPRLVVAVVINDLEGRKYYASQVAAPAFSEIMNSSLRLLDVPPDNA